MTQQPLLLHLPEDLYAQIQQFAEENNRPVENVVLDGLALLFGNLSDSTRLTSDVIKTFCDDELWILVHLPLAWSYEARLRELTALGKQGGLSPDEQTELERLIEQNDRHILARSEALLMLKQRGYAVEQYLRSGVLQPIS
jgi:hypothetical protein